MTGISAPVRRFEAFLRLWSRLGIAAREPGVIVVVEGERDRASLRRLGIDGPVQILHAGRSISDRVQELSAGTRRIIVLTDWDRAGGKLAHRLQEFGQGGRPTIDLEIRRDLSRLLRSEVIHVEGVASWAIRQAETLGRSLEEEFRSAGWETVVATE
jgi:5S rRNA maturation endonuclease (ribonuclease M5)